MIKENKHFCDFCAKCEDDVEKILTSTLGYVNADICNECIIEALEILVKRKVYLIKEFCKKL